MFLVVLTTVAMLLAFPLIAAANVPAIVNLTLDRTTASPGQSITVAVRTTPHTNYVFATVAGTRTQGTRIQSTANHIDWEISVTAPSTNADITVFANQSNQESGAANIRMPITVSGTATTNVATPEPLPQFVNPGPVGIAGVSETPATAANMVQLTVVTGPEANYVWVRFDSNRYVQGTRTATDATSRTWVVNFRPTTMQAQQVQVGSNRTYSYRGASLRNFDVTLSAPFVAPARPTIQNVSVSNRDVSQNSSTTFTIRTNVDATDVWVRTTDGREYDASRSSTASNSITWTVNFVPERSGTVSVYANSSRTSSNAARRTEHITVRGTGGGSGNGSILSASANGWSNNHLIIRATTNSNTNSVWAEVEGRVVQLSRTGAGGSNNTRHWEWSGNPWNWNNWNHNNWNNWNNNNWWNNNSNSNIRVHASSAFSSTSHADDSRWAVWGGHDNSWNHWNDWNYQPWLSGQVPPDVHVHPSGGVRPGETLTFVVRTGVGNFPRVIASAPSGWGIANADVGTSSIAGGWEATFTMTVPTNVLPGPHTINVHAHQNNSTIGTRVVNVTILP
jgi:hypothetical protein